MNNNIYAKVFIVSIFCLWTSLNWAQTYHQQGAGDVFPIGNGSLSDNYGSPAFNNPNYYYAAVVAAPDSVWYRQAGFSPDGTKILAQKSYKEGAISRTEIVLLNANGTGETIISAGNSGTGDIYGYMNPFWSDDGSVIGYHEVHNTAPNKVVRYELGTAAHSYLYEPVAPLDANNSDFLGASTTSIVFWDQVASEADLFTWDGSTLTNITNTVGYKEYEPVSNPDGTVILYWSGETVAEPVNTTHTLTYSGGVWTKDVSFTPIVNSYWSYWTNRSDNYIGTTKWINSSGTEDIYLYSNTGVFVRDMTGPGYTGGAGQWNFFGSGFEGQNHEFVLTTNAGRGAVAGRDIVIAAPRSLLYVNAATGNDLFPGTENAPFATIQKAVNEATAGAVIHVAAGTYNERLNIDKSITLNGAKSGIDARTRSTSSGESILDGTGFTGSPYNAIMIANGVSNVIIDGFEISNYAGSGSNGDGNAIFSYCEGGSTIGANNITVKNNYIHDLAYNGFLVGSENDNGTTMVVQTGWLIQYNKITNYHYAGIELTNVTNSQVKDNLISAPIALFFDPGDAGVGIEIAARSRSKPVTAGTDNVISGNTITGPFPADSRAAINLLSRTYAATSNATLTNVTVNANSISGATNVRAAILAVDESRSNGPATISTLAITNNTLDGNLDAIEIQDFVNSGTAAATHSAITVTGNEITNSSGNGIHVLLSTSASGISITSNKIVANSLSGIENEGTGTLAATCNWWGTSNAATIAGAVSGIVTYAPYLGDGTDGSADPGFQPAAICSGTCFDPPEYNASVTPGTSWTLDSKTLESDECYVYEVNLINGKEYTFKTGCDDGATADFDTWIEVYNAAGTSFLSNDDECEARRSKVTWTTPSSGATVAYVKVRGYGSNDYGNYTLAYMYGDQQNACKTPPDYNLAVTLAPGTTYTNTQTIGSDECFVYEIDPLIIGQEYTFKTGCGDGATADFDSWIEVYDHEGVSFLLNDDGCESKRSKVTWTATDIGPVFVKVRGYNSTAFGTYTLAGMYGDVQVICKTPPTSFDAEITWPSYTPGTWLNDSPRTIDRDACYVYKVTVIPGKEYTFKTGCDDGATADFDTWIDVYNDGGTLFLSNDDGCSTRRSEVVWTAPPGASFAYIKVRGYSSNDDGTYTLAYMYGDPTSQCKTPPDFNASITWSGPFTDTQTIISNGCYIYKVPVTLNKQYTFKTGCGDGATANFDTWIEVYSAVGASFLLNDDGCEIARSKVTWTSTYDGDAFVKVRGYNSDKFGTYTLVGTESTPSCKTPPASFDASISVGSSWATNTQTIGSDACYIYQVDLIDGKEFTFKTGCDDGATADFDSWIEVYDASGESFLMNDDGCEVRRSKVTWTATYTGHAYVKVRGYDSNASGEYTLAYKYGDPIIVCKTPPAFDVAVDLSSPGTYTNIQTIGTDACYIYYFTLTPGKQYTFKTGCGDGATADFDTWIEVYNEASASFLLNDDGCETRRSKVSWTATESHAYVKVRGYGSSDAGTYTLVGICSESTCKTPPDSDLPLVMSPIDTWDTSIRTISSSACVVYEVPVTSGKEYTFKTGCGNDAIADFDTWIELYNTAGTSLLSNDDGCEYGRSKVIWTATFSGDAFVKVRGYNSDEYGTYTLAYKYSDPIILCKTPTAYDYDVSMASPGTYSDTHTIGSDACYIYRVNQIDGKEYTFKTGCGDGATADFDTWIEVYDAAGVSFLYNDDGCYYNRSTVTWIAPPSSSFVYVKVRGYNSDEYGSYTLVGFCDDGKKSSPVMNNLSIQDAVTVFPNPANQLITISSQAPFNFTGGYICDFTGRLVKTWELSKPLNTYQIDISDYSNGTYFITIKTSDGLVRKKLIINK